MYIKFKTLEFKNIGSYGNTPTKVDFRTGINLISGQNGRGKSMIIEALCFCLFGQPYRDIKINELVNRVNKKNLFTKCEFDIGNDSYIITRTLKKDSISITKNGNDLELLSTKRLTQDEINKILEINLTMFRQVISLAVNHNKPFLSLKASDKREIIENIFDIVVFADMLKIVKMENVNLKSKYDINTRSYSILSSNLKESKGQLKEFHKLHDNFESIKKHDNEKLEHSIKVNNDLLTKARSNVVKGVDHIDKIKQTLHNVDLETYDNLTSELSVKNFNLNRLQKEVDFYNNNDICFTCKTPLTEDHKNSHIEKNNNEIQLIQNEIKRLNKEIVKTKSHIDSNKEKNDKIKLINEKLIEEQNKIRFYSEKDRTLNEELLNKKASVFNVNIEKFEAEKNKKETELNSLENDLNTTSQELKINNTIVSILSDQGVKSHFFKKLIPILNTKVNDYIDKFDIPIKLEFDEFMNESISTFAGKYKDIAYSSFSDGEKKRIDTAILLSFIETTKSITNWNCNLLMLDEILDTSLDTEGFEKLFDGVKEMRYNNNDLCIYVISHRIPAEYFDRVLYVKKDGVFSAIQQDQKN
jgi:DNA repair exonuclease SbcCD ATPase subunit